MVSVTKKQLAKLLLTTENEVTTILQREGVRLKDAFGITKIIQKYKRHKVLNKRTKKTSYKRQWIKFTTARRLLDDILFTPIKKKYTKCQQCLSREVLQLHHIDHNHYNNNLNNLIVICRRCHFLVHKESSLNTKYSPLLTVTMAMVYTGKTKSEILRLSFQGKVLTIKARYTKEAYIPLSYIQKY